jgi:hypothetical protein
MIDPVVTGLLVSVSLIVGYLAGAVVATLGERGKEMDSL